MFPQRLGCLLGGDVMTIEYQIIIDSGEALTGWLSWREVQEEHEGRRGEGRLPVDREGRRMSIRCRERKQQMEMFT